MQTIKSPFLIHQGLVPRKFCLEISELAFNTRDGYYSEAINNEEANNYAELLASTIQNHYGYKVVESTVNLDTYTTAYQPLHAMDGHVFQGGKWYRNKDIDFVSIIFLKENQQREALDLSYEVFGGKLEFPTFNFGFMPELGTSVTFPCTPNFLNTFGRVKLGELDVLRVHHRSDRMFVYQPVEFNGSPKDWFRDLS